MVCGDGLVPFMTYFDGMTEEEVIEVGRRNIQLKRPDAEFPSASY
jgi:hypothetical protein